MGFVGLTQTGDESLDYKRLGLGNTRVPQKQGGS